MRRSTSLNCSFLGVKHYLSQWRQVYCNSGKGVGVEMSPLPFVGTSCFVKVPPHNKTEKVQSQCNIETGQFAILCWNWSSWMAISCHNKMSPEQSSPVMSQAFNFPCWDQSSQVIHLDESSRIINLARVQSSVTLKLLEWSFSDHTDYYKPEYQEVTPTNFQPSTLFADRIFQPTMMQFSSICS